MKRQRKIDFYGETQAWILWFAKMVSVVGFVYVLVGLFFPKLSEVFAAFTILVWIHTTTIGPHKYVEFEDIPE